MALSATYYPLIKSCIVQVVSVSPAVGADACNAGLVLGPGTSRAELRCLCLQMHRFEVVNSNPVQEHHFFLAAPNYTELDPSGPGMGFYCSSPDTLTFLA